MSLKKFGLLAAICFMTGLSSVCAAETTETAQQGNAAIASADEKTSREEVVEDWMVPIYADELNDGTYAIEARSNSSMFAIESCELTVADGEMKAVLTMGGKGYLKVFMGTVEEAAAADEEECIPFAEDENGRNTFEVPVEALDQGIDCAAFSKKKEKWYDRVLVFVSTSLPEDAFKELDMTTAEDLGLEDGTYLVDVTLSGGSGKASVQSPAEITVTDGEITAEIIFSSKNYDYMLVNDVKYENQNPGGNSTFYIPVRGFDYSMAVIADTLAMSVPHEISYTLFFDSASMEDAA